MNTIEENSLEDMAQKAITCLYIEVDASIADDVKQRVGAYICQLKRLRAEAEAEIQKLRCTTDRICGSHIGAVDVHLTGNFALGCPCCQRDCAQISLQGYITAATVTEPANADIRHGG